MTKRIVTTDDATGVVISQWQGGDEQELDVKPGRTQHTLQEDDEADYGGMRWNGKAFEPASAPLDAADQLSRIEAKLDDLASAIGTVETIKASGPSTSL